VNQGLVIAASEFFQQNPSILLTNPIWKRRRQAFAAVVSEAQVGLSAL